MERCRWRDSNPQPLRDLFLRQARIPFRHTGSFVWMYDNASGLRCQERIFRFFLFRSTEFSYGAELLVTLLQEFVYG